MQKYEDFVYTPINQETYTDIHLKATEDVHIRYILQTFVLNARK